MDAAPGDPHALLERSLDSGRIHSAYLFSGPGSEPRDAALRFARGIACRGAAPRPCERCDACRRSRPREEIALDGAGRQGPLYRHVGDHPDLYWIERGSGDTRVRIGQIRALQQALRLKSSQGGRRAAVVADAGWLNQEAQNALLRLLEEPPPDTTLVLVAASAAGLLATVRSRCQRIGFRARTDETADADETAALRARLDAIAAASVPDLLDWADQYRGPRAVAAARVEALIEAATSHLRGRVAHRVSRGGREVSRELAALRVLSECRRALSQRNANPQMVAERTLMAVQDGVRA
jgi:hypothetical protein